MKTKLIIVIVVVLITLAGLVSYKGQIVKNDAEENSATSSEQIVGGDKDIHGCIGSAGYSWCEVKNKCLRVWEEKCESISTGTENKITANSSEKCLANNGVWYPVENVCEINSLSQEGCLAKGGVFNECASACRHDPKAEICTMQCVLTCTFK